EFYAMVDEHRAAGGTVFLSSHILPEVERLARRVGIIREGRLVEVATLDELRAKAVRSFEVTFDEPVSEADFLNVEAVSEVSVVGQLLTCQVAGSVDAFVKAVARHRVANFQS